MRSKPTFEKKAWRKCTSKCVIPNRIVTKALQWFSWVEHSGAIDGWHDFTQSPNARFSPSGYDDPTGLLAKLKQSSSVQDYQEQFENLANRTEGLTKSFMVSYFIVGPKEEIRLGVQMFWPNSLSTTTSLARLQKKNLATRRLQGADNFQPGLTNNQEQTEVIYHPSRNSARLQWKHAETRDSITTVIRNTHRDIAVRDNSYTSQMEQC